METQAKARFWQNRKLRDAALSLVAGILVGASSASLSTHADEDCIERTDLIGQTRIQQVYVPNTLGCTIHVKWTGARMPAASTELVIAPEGQNIVKFEGLDANGWISIRKADGSMLRIHPERFEVR